MIESIKVYAKISAVSILNWLLVALPGILLTLIFFLFVFLQNFPQTGFITYVTELAKHNPCALVMIFGMPFFIVLYIWLANKVAIETLIHGVWTKKAMQFVEPEFKRIVNKLLSRQTGLSRITDAAVLRARLLDENRNDPSVSSINRRLIAYGLRKIRLDEVDLKSEKMSTGDIISSLFLNLISESISPGFTLVWILYGIEVVFFICSQVYH